MRLIRILGPGLVAVLVASFGVLAASASAQLKPPIWYECHKLEKKEGKYTGRYKRGCTEAATNPAKEGKYELQAGSGVGKHLTGKLGESTLRVKSPLGEQAITCQGGKIEGGYATEPNRVNGFRVAYKKCSLGGKTTCYSTLPKGKPGEIKTKELQGELGWIKEESPREVGLRVEATGEEETVEDEAVKPLAKFECGTFVTDKETHAKKFAEEVSTSVYGQLIGVQTEDLNTLGKDLTLEYVAGEHYGTHEFEGKPFKPVVNILGWASEVEAITEAQKEDKEAEHPAHVLRGVYCGPLVEGLVHKECTPLTDSALEWKAAIKGELLMVKEEEA